MLFTTSLAYCQVADTSWSARLRQTQPVVHNTNWLVDINYFSLTLIQTLLLTLVFRQQSWILANSNPNRWKPETRPTLTQALFLTLTDHRMIPVV